MSPVSVPLIIKSSMEMLIQGFTHESTDHQLNFIMLTNKNPLNHSTQSLTYAMDVKSFAIILQRWMLVVAVV